MKRILMMIMCVVMAISLFGCGQSNEQKYMSLRNEVETEMKAYDKLVASIPDHTKGTYAVSREEFRAKYLPHYEKALPEIEAMQKKVTIKLEEMEKLAKNDVKLKTDFDKFASRNLKVLQSGIKVCKRNIERYK